MAHDEAQLDVGHFGDRSHHFLDSERSSILLWQFWSLPLRSLPPSITNEASFIPCEAAILAIRTVRLLPTMSPILT